MDGKTEDGQHPGLNEVKTLFTKTADELKGLIDQQTEEIRKHGETSTETQKKIADAEKRLGEFDEARQTILKRIDDLDKELSRSGGGREDGGDFKSLGQMFVESDEYKEMVEQKRSVSDRFEIKDSLTAMRRKQYGFMNLYAPPGGTGLAPAFRPADWVIPPVQRLRIRDLMNVVQLVGTDSVQYVRETGFSMLITETTAAIDGVATVIPVRLVTGFYVGQRVTIETDGGGTVTRTVTATDREASTITVDAAPGAAAEGSKVRANSLAGTPPTLEKPDMDMELSLRTQSVVTVAGSVTVPRQSLADINRLRNYIDTKLVYALDLSEETHILYGDGSDEMMPGILTDEARQTYLWSAGGAGDTKIDAIRRSITRVMLADYEPNGVVIHPNDWEDIELAKGNDAHYIWVTITQGGQRLLWALPVVVTRAVAEGTAVVGAWGLGGTLYDREDAAIRLFEQHADYAKKNLALILGEQRATTTWERPESFVEVSFDNAPA